MRFFAIGGGLPGGGHPDFRQVRVTSRSVWDSLMANWPFTILGVAIIVGPIVLSVWLMRTSGVQR